MAVLSCLFFMGCTQSLESAVKDMQAELPMDSGDGMTITECTINGNMLEFVMQYDESEFSLDDEFTQSLIKMGIEESKDDFIGDEDVKKLLKICKEEDKGMRMLMVGAKSKARFVAMEFTPEELQKLSL